MSVLEAERQFYDTMKYELLKTHPGQFALIHDNELIGVYTTFKEAFSEGVKLFGRNGYLIQRITPEGQRIQHPALDVGAIVAH